MMPNRKSLLALGIVASLLSVLQPPSLALAQDEPSESTASSDRELDGDPEGRASDDGEPAGGRSSDIQEVIHVEGVRASGLKDVPISVTQFGASDIQNLRIQNVADLSAYTPNLEINTAFAASNPTLFIRGVGLKDYNSNSTGAVSIWQDGIMMNSPAAQLFSLFDIESIEILKGPIGGIGGRNASAGQIRIHSFQPTEEWTSDGSFSYGNLNLLQFEGALGFPIFPEFFNNTLSFRVAVTTEFRDGYTNNVCANWDPEKFGYLASTPERTLEFYNSLEPEDRGPAFPNNKRFIYRNIEAVELYNSSVGQNTINITTVDGERVGRQSDFFRILPDGACLLDNAGRVVTHKREARANSPAPEGTFIPQNNVKPLSDYQGLQDTYNDIEYYASRFQLLWEPSERWSFLGNFHWGANRGDSHHLQAVGARPKPSPLNAGEITDSPGFFEAANSDGFTEIGLPLAPFEDPKKRDGLFGDQQGLTPGFAGDDVFNGFYSTDGDEDLDLWGVVLHTTYEPDWGRIEYVGGYEFNSRDILDEGGDCPCTDLEAELDDETWQFSNDLRVVVDGNRFEWTFGFFQLHEELDSFNHYPSSIRFEIDQTYQQITDAYNVGTNLHYDFLEDAAYRWLYQISFDGAFRYDWEKKEFTLGALSRKVFADVEKTSIPEKTVKGNWDGPAGEATLSILPVENARLYFKATHGRKAGHFNAGLTVTDRGGGDELFSSFDEVEQETVWAVEVGLKSSWFDDRLELNGAFFRYWYKDMQVFDIVNDFGKIPTQRLLNADADVMGAEADLTIRPLDGLLLRVSMGWLDTAYGEFLIVKRAVAASGQGPSQGFTNVFNYEDNPLIAAPEWSLTGYAEYELPLYRWGSLVPSFNFSYKSRTYLDPTHEELISQKPFWLFGARLSYRTPGGTIEVAGWVKNFLDRQYKIDAFDLTRQYGQINEVWAEPRTYGLSVSYSF